MTKNKATPKPDVAMTPAQLNKITRRAVLLTFKGIVSNVGKERKRLKKNPDEPVTQTATVVANDHFGKENWARVNINHLWLFPADAHSFLIKHAKPRKGSWLYAWSQDQHSDAMTKNRFSKVATSAKASYTDDDQTKVIERNPIYEWKDCLLLMGLDVGHSSSDNRIDIMVGPEETLQQRLEELEELYLKDSLVAKRYSEVWSDLQGLHFNITKPEDKDIIYDKEDQNKIERVVRIIDNWDKLAKGERRIGMLLYGPPGTGKTATLSRLTQLLKGKATIFNVKGGSQQTLINVYDWLDRMGPNIIIVEDFDTIAGERGLDNSTTPFLSLLLNVLDGAKHHDVITIATTNHPEVIDAGMTRPGRLGVSIKLSEPEPEHKRKIIEHYIKKYGLQELGCIYSKFDAKGVLGCHIQSILHHVFVEGKLGGDLRAALDDACNMYFAADNINWKDNGGKSKVGFGS